MPKVSDLTGQLIPSTGGQFYFTQAGLDWSLTPDSLYTSFSNNYLKTSSPTISTDNLGYNYSVGRIFSGNLLVTGNGVIRLESGSGMMAGITIGDYRTHGNSGLH